MRVFLNGIANYNGLIGVVKGFLLASSGQYFSSQILLGILASHSFSMASVSFQFSVFSPFSALKKKKSKRMQVPGDASRELNLLIRT